MNHIANVLPDRVHIPSHEQAQSEPDTAPVVRFPTLASWHEYVMAHPGIPSVRYCKYGCGGVGFFRRDVPVGHPLFGKPAPCPCVKERAAMDDAERLNEYRESLSPIEQTFTLDNWIGDDKEALEVARRAAAQGWGMFIFWGLVGRAKSGLLAGIVNDCLDNGRQAVYKVATHMLDELRGAYETETFDAEMNALRGVKVLALDEMWRFSGTAWAQEKIFQLLDYRYRYYDRLLTVVATNARPDMNDPLWSRFGDTQRSKIQEVRGADVRPLT